VEEAIYPFLREAFWQGEGKEYGQRLPAHGRDIAQPAGQATAPDDFRGMPLAPEVDILEREIGSDQQLVAGGRPQNGAVVPDAGNDGRTPTSLPPDTRNERFLSERQELTITSPQAPEIARIFRAEVVELRFSQASAESGRLFWLPG